MFFTSVQNLKDIEFRRLTGVKRSTFNHMVKILLEAERKKKVRGGRPNDLIMEDRLLMTLCYLREYRTYFHTAVTYGVSESACFRTVVWIEDVLVKHPDFTLPGRKAVAKSDSEFEVILVDVTESPIERPKKNSAATTRVRKKDILILLHFGRHEELVVN